MFPREAEEATCTGYGFTRGGHGDVDCSLTSVWGCCGSELEDFVFFFLYRK